MINFFDWCFIDWRNLLFKVDVDNILIKFIWEEGQLNSNVVWSLDVIL